MVYIWTDFGGVLTPPIRDSMTVFCDNHGLTLPALHEAMQAVGRRHSVTDPMELLDTGTMAEKEWLEELSEELNGAIQLDTLADVWFSDQPPNQPWIDQLRSYRSEGLGVGLISNMVPTWDGHWQRMLNEPALFDHIVLSFEVESRKPDRQIFEHAARIAEVDPSECILVDDLPANCEGARAAGWHAIEFTTAQAAASQLRDLLAHHSPVHDTGRRSNA